MSLYMSTDAGAAYMPGRLICRLFYKHLQYREKVVLLSILTKTKLDINSKADFHTQIEVGTGVISCALTPTMVTLVWIVYIDFKQIIFNSQKRCGLYADY